MCISKEKEPQYLKYVASLIEMFLYDPAIEGQVYTLPNNYRKVHRA